MDYFGSSSRAPASTSVATSPGRHIRTPRGTPNHGSPANDLFGPRWGSAASGTSAGGYANGHGGALPAGMSDGRANATLSGTGGSSSPAGAMTHHPTALNAGLGVGGVTHPVRAKASVGSPKSTTPRLSPPPRFQNLGGGPSNPFFASAATAGAGPTGDRSPNPAMPSFPSPEVSASFNFNNERRRSVASTSSSSSSPPLRASAPLFSSTHSTRHSSPVPNFVRATTPLSPGKHSAPSPTFSSPAHGPSPAKKGALARPPADGPNPGRSILDPSNFIPGDRLPLPVPSPLSMGFDVSNMDFGAAVNGRASGSDSWPPAEPTSSKQFRLPAVAPRRPSSSASLPPAPTASTSSASIGVTADQLVRFVQEEEAQTLVLDVRMASAFRSQRIRGSVGVNVPTTLLRRPAYGVEKIEATLETPAERTSFSRYRNNLPASGSDPSKSPALNRILVIDANTNLASLPAAHPLLQILGKFSAAGCAVSLGHVIGGFRAVALVPGVESILETEADSSRAGPAAPRIDSAASSVNASAMPSPATATTGSGRAGFMRMSLPTPKAAFAGLDPTALATSRQAATNPMLGKVNLDGPPTPGVGSRPSPRTRQSGHLFTQTQPQLSPSAHSPLMSSSRLGSRRSSGAPKMSLPSSAFTNATVDCSTGKLGEIGTPAELGEGSAPSAMFSKAPFQHTGSSGSSPFGLYSPPLASPAAYRATNPFFDNIRQLSEGLSLERSLKNLTPVSLPQLTPRSLEQLPPWMRKLLAESEMERANRLAHEFYDLEKAECSRLQEVMKWHCGAGGKQGEGEAAADSHPFSISAGVELGYKNRYKNIWPWEHARVRLHTGAGMAANDYVNASAIKLTGTHKEYIATQGPLQATYDDFWQVVAQEDVGVIVMLTKQREEGREKCGDYLRSGVYGDVVVKIEGREGCGDGAPAPDGFFGFFPPAQDAPADANQPVMVAKTLTIRRLSQPQLPAKQIRHIQYLAWPDFDVPPETEEVLELVQLVNDHAREVAEYNQALGLPADSLGKGPMIVHCSAGVGRTGSFIVIDTMLDVLRQQIAAMVKNGDRLAPTDDRGSSDASSGSSAASSASTAPTSADEDDLISPMRQGRKWMDIDSPEPEQGIFARRESRALSLLPTTTVDDDSAMQGLESASAPSAGKRSWEDLYSAHPRGPKTPLPCFLKTQYCDVNAARKTPPLWQSDPILPTVNELREQRMSMVANYRQYVYVHEAILAGLIKELHLHLRAH